MTIVRRQREWQPVRKTFRTTQLFTEFLEEKYVRNYLVITSTEARMAALEVFTRQLMNRHDLMLFETNAADDKTLLAFVLLKRVEIDEDRYFQPKIQTLTLHENINLQELIKSDSVLNYAYVRNAEQFELAASILLRTKHLFQENYSKVYSCRKDDFCILLLLKHVEQKFFQLHENTIDDKSYNMFNDINTTKDQDEYSG